MRITEGVVAHKPLQKQLVFAPDLVNISWVMTVSSLQQRVSKSGF